METYDGPVPAGIRLSDTAEEINTKVNGALRQARMAPGGARSPALEAEVFKLLGKPVPPKMHLAPIEVWAMGLTEAKQGTEGKIYQPVAADSQYKDTSTVVLMGGLAPVMLVNGILIGTDKLGHFFQLAYTDYYKAVLGGKGRSDAISEGNKSEAGMFGVELTGVYSNADLAANQSGLMFYEELARNPNLIFDIRKYVSAQWNEQSNPNLYGGSLKRLWRDSITGTWQGSFNWSDGTTGTAAFKAQLNVIGARSYDDLRNGINNIEGTYQYFHPKASHTSGKLTGKVLDVVNADSAVYRVDVNVDWAEGTAKGKGTMTLSRMHQMDGKWGRGGSADDGGTWTFVKA